MTEPAASLVQTILASVDPFTLGVFTGQDDPAAGQLLDAISDDPDATDDDLRAYDLVHQLRVFGRAF